ncbi:hypothetical protein ACJIZ3_018821 [Penstemon smallii]|uniref:BRX domain-containing protein n=1 Tax=Penstemon smallii TaxID=265156 RepID=A0ABD3SZE8_9LAMI
MLTCMARSKQPSDDSSSFSTDHQNHPPEKLQSKQAIKTLSSQIKDMALKASGAYRHCAPCATTQPPAGQNRSIGESDSVASDKFRWSYRRTGSSNSSSTAGKRELEARLKGISSGEGTPASASGRRVDPVVFVEENEPKEWVAQVEPGVLITFVSLPGGGNDLKRIRFRCGQNLVYDPRIIQLPCSALGPLGKRNSNQTHPNSPKKEFIERHKKRDAYPLSLQKLEFMTSWASEFGFITRDKAIAEKHSTNGKLKNGGQRIVKR